MSCLLMYDIKRMHRNIIALKPIVYKYDNSLFALSECG